MTEPWILIEDDTWTGAALSAEIEQRAAVRSAEMGSLIVEFPSFGYLSELPQPPSDRAYNANLYHHLRLANEMPPPATAPVLADSPATRTPLVGKLWQRIRGQVHELILFYVNRSVRDQTQLNNELISTLNELTRTVDAQQAEIERLRAALNQQQQEQP